MKESLLATLLLTSTLYLGLASSTAAAQSTQGKTRAQVKQEMVQAQHDGAVPSTKTQYPPTEQMVQRNKDVHNTTTHAGESSPSVDHHD